MAEAEEANAFSEFENESTLQQQFRKQGAVLPMPRLASWVVAWVRLPVLLHWEKIRPLPTLWCSIVLMASFPVRSKVGGISLVANS